MEKEGRMITREQHAIFVTEIIFFFWSLRVSSTSIFPVHGEGWG